MASILKQRRDTTANWATNNPVIPDGQLCFDTDLKQYRMGNGTDNYSDLSPGGLTAALSEDLDFNGFTGNKSAVRQIANAAPADAATHNFNYAEGDMQKVTCPAAGTLTLTFSGLPAGDVAGFVVDLVNAGDCVLTWPAGIEYAAGTPPSFTAAGTDRVLIMKDSANILVLTVIALDIK